MIAAKIGSLLYRSVEFLVMNIGASHKVTMTLDYRRRWHHFIGESKTTQPTLWIHGASVGELEDLAAFYGNEELLKKAGYDFSRLVITSSSPSAEEFLLKIKAKFNPLYAGPLPPDVFPRVEEFFEKLKPELLILSQSDMWPVLMSVAKTKLKKGAIWLPHKKQSASWGRDIFLKDLVKVVGLRRSDSSNPLSSAQEKFIGSPRVDRILERIQKSQREAHPLSKEISHSSAPFKVLIGSAWIEDALLVQQTIEALGAEKRKLIEVYAIPHDTKNPTELSAISRCFGNKMIAREGILLESYKNFDIAFVGGGFRTGLHNIIEPLAWGIPTLCGDDLRKQPEAPYYVNQGALKAISSVDELQKLFESLLASDTTFHEWKEKALDAQKLLASQSGASERLAVLIQDTHATK